MQKDLKKKLWKKRYDSYLSSDLSIITSIEHIILTHSNCIFILINNNNDFFITWVTWHLNHVAHSNYELFPELKNPS